jgi:uncharacterized protein YbjT (DUF2867 family)
MYIILGGNGHIGSAVAQALLDYSQPVTIISRNAEKTDYWKQKGAQLAIADVHDTNALHEVLRKGRRLFLLNPPADPSTDTATEERKSLASILKALEGAGLEKIVAQSTYGAQPGQRIGDLGVLYEMEQSLTRQAVPATIIRAAYYMSNWDMALPGVRQESKLYSLYPADFKLPMVSPQDIGRIAAQLLMEPAEKTGLHYVEGPDSYSPADVAAAFAAALGKPVKAHEIPQEQWVPMLRTSGFSAEGAESMAAMTTITLEQKYELPDSPLRGSTTIQAYVSMLVKEQIQKGN